MITSLRTPQITIPLRWAMLLVLFKAGLTSTKICQAVSGTSGTIRPTVGTLDPCLFALQGAGLVKEHWLQQPLVGKPRTVYQISELGAAEVKAFFEFHQNFSDLGIALNQELPCQP
jgi:DNA-binding PadR family transcriptional regulator